MTRMSCSALKCLHRPIAGSQYGMIKRPVQGQIPEAPAGTDITISLRGMGPKREILENLKEPCGAPGNIKEYYLP